MVKCPSGLKDGKLMGVSGEGKKIDQPAAAYASKINQQISNCIWVINYCCFPSITIYNLQITVAHPIQLRKRILGKDFVLNKSIYCCQSINSSLLESDENHELAKCSSAGFSDVTR